jgi:AAA15 family ATPase/GTPase
MNLLPALADLKKEKNVYVIDELDRRMHPLLTRMFLETFLNDENSEKQSQLIFTTHDTNLLDSSLLRRDEIWFISKNEQGSSELVSLSDFSVRKDLRIDKWYLLGRFGAVPYTKNVTPVQNLVAG